MVLLQRLQCWGMHPHWSVLEYWRENRSLPPHGTDDIKPDDYQGAFPITVNFKERTRLFFTGTLPH